MYRIFSAVADTYITNKFVNGERQVSASLGSAGTLDIFKLYGITEETSGSTKIPLKELSRALIKFDISDLEDLYQNGKIDISHSTFKCQAVLKDVYGGQTTPRNFNLVLSPLSRSFDEGVGKDVSYYADWDVANFLSSSGGVGWNQEGAGLGASSESGNCDFITTSLLGGATPVNLQVTQSFADGTEDAVFDVTQIVSATLAGLIPDSGFRLALAAGEENDNFTYFVKRFASRHAHNPSYRPKLIVKFDDSIKDTSSTMFIGSSGSLFAYNYGPNGPTNFISNGVELTGSNCVKLTLVTNQLSGQYSTSFTGSQLANGSVITPGIYYADVIIPLTSQMTGVLSTSGSLTFTPTWKTMDGATTLLEGDDVEFSSPFAASSFPQKKRYTVSAYGVPTEILANIPSLVRIHVFDQMSPRVFLKKFAAETPSVGFRRAYYQVRDVLNDEIVIPFDTTDDSTRVSTDSKGQYFFLNPSSLLPNRSYVVDFMTVDGAGETVYKNVSNPFRVVDS